MEQYMSWALPLLAVAGIPLAFAFGLAMYRGCRHKETELRTGLDTESR